MMLALFLNKKRLDFIILTKQIVAFDDTLDRAANHPNVILALDDIRKVTKSKSKRKVAKGTTEPMFSKK